MQAVKNKDSEIELLLRKELWRRGLRYRKNVKTVFGHPDIAFIGKKIAVFCDSEFFHGKDWDVLEARMKKGNNGSFWIAKISRNMERDNDVNKKLRSEEWTVLRFWGEEIKKNLEECISAVDDAVLDYKLNHGQDYS